MRRVTKGVLLAPVMVIAFATVGCNRTGSRQAANDPAPAASPAAPADQRGEMALATAVQAKFYADEQVRGQDVDVSAEGGTVTLRGTVASEAAKQHAVNLARSVQGVTSLNDELQVQQTVARRSETGERDAAATTGTTGRATDIRQPWWITTKIQAQYFADADVKPWSVDVTTSSRGVVTLEGTVDSVEAKNEAVRIARDTEGVAQVDDRLRVEANAGRGGSERNTAGAGGITAPDAWLTAKVQAKYFIDDDVKGRNIDVETQNGVVTLTGTVASEAERRQAVAIARNTDGVRDVTDKLRVETTMAVAGPTPAEQRTGAESMPGANANVDRPDAWITTKIQSKYFLDADVKGHGIDVDTRDGVVTLKGRVENAQQKAEAEQIARETVGVTRVNNQLTVGAASAP